MSEDAPDSERPVRGSRWSDTPSRDALQAIAEGVAEAAGFDLVGISVARDDGYLHTLVLVGPEEARWVLIDSLAPVDQLLVQLETAEDWGALKVIPHDKLVLDIEKWGWFSDAPRDNVAAGAWHPEDMLIAPLEGADGAFLGFLGMELPRDGLVPSAEKRAMLEIYARQAGRAVITTLERERLAERVRLAGTAADIVRLASGTQSPEALLAEAAGRWPGASAPTPCGSSCSARTTAATGRCTSTVGRPCGCRPAYARWCRPTPSGRGSGSASPCSPPTGRSRVCWAPSRWPSCSTSSPASRSGRC
jgi:hypothetical protein